jgi:citrate synthase
VRTRIWEESVDPDNPYLAGSARCHGYALEEMIGQLDFADTLFLLLRGELPSAPEARLLQRFLVAFCNPGPRHAATRAVMNAAVSGTRSASLAAIGLTVLGGEHLGSAEVERCVRFIARHRDADPRILATSLANDGPATGDTRVAPGFGTLYGGIDTFASRLAGVFCAAAPHSETLLWANRFAESLRPSGSGWLVPGVAAAVASELGFSATASGMLYQMASLPGLMAHGLEMSGQPITAMPFIGDEHYTMRNGDDASAGKRE